MAGRLGSFGRQGTLTSVFLGVMLLSATKCARFSFAAEFRSVHYRTIRSRVTISRRPVPFANQRLGGGKNFSFVRNVGIPGPSLPTNTSIQLGKTLAAAQVGP